jgi:hypothetical protein
MARERALPDDDMDQGEEPTTGPLADLLAASPAVSQSDAENSHAHARRRLILISAQQQRFSGGFELF